MKGILLDPETGDVRIKSGGMVVDENVQQVAEHILRANRGEYREFPLYGAEVLKLRNGIASRMWCADTKQMLRACRVGVEKVSIKDNVITLE